MITEGRESGTVGSTARTAGARGRRAAAVAAAGVDRVLFEAPRKDQQAWLIRRFGPDVNLGNIASTTCSALETLRLGLRADTVELVPPVAAGVTEPAAATRGTSCRGATAGWR